MFMIFSPSSLELNSYVFECFRKSSCKGYENCKFWKAYQVSDAFSNTKILNIHVISVYSILSIIYSNGQEEHLINQRWCNTFYVIQLVNLLHASTKYRIKVYSTLLCIQEVPHLNFGSDTGCPDMFRVFLCLSGYLMGQYLKLGNIGFLPPMPSWHAQGKTFTINIWQPCFFWQKNAFHSLVHTKEDIKIKIPLWECNLNIAASADNMPLKEVFRG